MKKRNGEKMSALTQTLSAIDNFVWGPIMLFFLLGTGIFLTVKTRALCWRNLPYALRLVLSRKSRQKQGTGDVSPFSALTTALAATIGTGNIVGVATAMVSGGPGALVWMWIAAAFGLTTKFSECMLALKYRTVGTNGEMAGGPMYTMKHGFPNKRVGAILGWFFAFFAVLASFGIGNLTQSNSIAASLYATFSIPRWLSGLVITLLASAIILGGIRSRSKISQIVVPVMALLYIIIGLIVILGNIKNLPAGLFMIIKMAFSPRAVSGGLCGSLTASMAQALRYGVSRGIFSNEAGMGSAAITAAAATSSDPVRQGYINMTGTFWDTIVVCTITGLCIASSGVLGSTQETAKGTYYYEYPSLTISSEQDNRIVTSRFHVILHDSNAVLVPQNGSDSITLTLPDSKNPATGLPENLTGTWLDASKNEYIFSADGDFSYQEIPTGSALTIAAFQTVLGKPGGWMLAVCIALFAFSTILGWEYQGEKAFEYLIGSQRFNRIYRIAFSLLGYIGATTSLQAVWCFSDIANALMALPNLICLLALRGDIVREINRYQSSLKKNA